MNLTDFKGKAVGLIIAGHIPAVRFIVVSEESVTYSAVSVIRDEADEGHLGGTNIFAYTDEFKEIVSLSTFKESNPGGWDAFSRKHAFLSASMESSAS